MIVSVYWPVGQMGLSSFDKLLSLGDGSLAKFAVYLAGLVKQVL
jgi:hypothetical protein